MKRQARPQLLVDAETQRVLEANEAAARAYGYRPAELAGMPEQAGDQVLAAVDSAVRGGDRALVTLVFPRAQNRPA